MSDAGELLRIEGISRRFGRTTAVEHLDAGIDRAEFVTLLGPSGCGKSTTLRILGGFETTDSGRVLLDGEDITDRPPNRRNVNMVFQDYALFPHMTVRQNMAFGLELQGMDRGAIRRRLDDSMAFLELAGLADRYPGQLSGGQRQRVALARALALDPALLLLDEPLGALDARLRSQIRQELKSIQRQTGKTFLFVTHDQEEALTMSDRILVMNRGRVEQDGTPEQLYFRPASRFVAEFIGETNLLQGRVRGVEGDRVAIEWQQHLLHARAPERPPAAGDSVAVSLRRERIRLPDAPAELANRLPARLVGRTFLGSRMVVDLVPEGADGVRLQAYADNTMTDIAADARIWIGWDADSMAVLPAGGAASA